jgi:predicted DNA-binding WGR domain protein
MRSLIQAVDDDATYLEHEKGVFWSIVVAGSCTRVRYGKLGEEGSVSEKEHANEKAAEKFKEKMLKEKTKKGYEEAEKA